MSNLLVNGKITSTGGGEFSYTKTKQTNLMQSNEIDLTTNPTSTKYRYTEYLDKNEKRIGIIGAKQRSSGYYGVYLQASNNAWFDITWNGIESKIQFMDKDVSVVDSITDTYVRYTNGLQICWGIKASEGTANDHTTIITYPKPFKSGTIPAVDAIVYRTSLYNDTNYKHQVTSITNANFKYSDWMIRETADKISWIAIGKWK